MSRFFHRGQIVFLATMLPSCNCQTQPERSTISLEASATAAAPLARSASVASSSAIPSSDPRRDSPMALRKDAVLARSKLPIEVEPRRLCTQINSATLAVPDPGEKFDLVLMTTNLGHHTCLDGSDCDSSFKDLDPILEDLSALANNVAQYSRDRRFVLALQGAWQPGNGWKEGHGGDTRSGWLAPHIKKYFPDIAGHREDQYAYWTNGFKDSKFAFHAWTRNSDTFNGYLSAQLTPTDARLPTVQLLNFRFDVNTSHTGERSSQIDQLNAAMRSILPQAIAAGDANASACYSNTGIDAVCAGDGCRVLGLESGAGARRNENVDWVTSRLKCDSPPGSELFSPSDGCADIIAILTSLAPTPLFTYGYWAPMWFPHDETVGTTINHLAHTVSIVGFRHVPGPSCGEICAGSQCGSSYGCKCGECERFQECKAGRCVEHPCEHGYKQCTNGTCVRSVQSCPDE